MKKVKILIVTLLLTAIMTYPIYAVETADINLDINGAMTLGEKYSLDIQRADWDTTKAQANRDKAMDSFTYSIPTSGMVSSETQSIVGSFWQAQTTLNSAKKTQSQIGDQIKLSVITNYIQAIKTRNNIENMKQSLSNLDRQLQIAQVACKVGYMSSHDFINLQTSRSKMDDSIKSTEASYQTSITSLRTLFRQSESWQPVLTSIPTIKQFQRNDIGPELTLAVDQSASVYAAKQNLDIADLQKNWLLANTPYKAQAASYEQSVIDYAKAQVTAKSTLEQLYHNIDGMEQQIEAADKAYQQAQKDLKVAEYKYKLGLIAEYSISDGDSLTKAKLAVESAKVTLENLQADLVGAKANYCYLTGRTVFDANDWSTTK